MKLDFFTVLFSTAVLVAYAIPGFLLRRKKLMTDQGLDGMSNLLIFVCQPMLTLSSFQAKGYEPGLLGGLGIMAVLAFVTQLGMFFVVRPIFARYNRTDAQKGVYVFASVLGNCGFMGIPLLKSLFPGNADVILYAAVYILIFNMITWTMGIYMLTGNAGYVKLRYAVLNPPVLMLAVALPLFFLNINLAEHVPSVADAVNVLGAMTTPLSMLIMGSRLADMPVKDLLSDSAVYMGSAIKLLLMPALVWALVLLLPIPQLLKTVLVLISAMPSGASVAAYAQKFKGDVYAASKILLVCTLLSIITLPLVSLLL